MPFKKIKNMDTAFRQMRTFTLVIIITFLMLSAFVIQQSFQQVSALNSRIYLLENGQVLKAVATERNDNLAVEIRDHIKTFHRLFFSLDPDETVIQDHMRQALYLADRSAKKIYDDLQENGYLSSIISGNISQRIKVDSIHLNIDAQPYTFRCFATEQIIRTTSNIKRRLISSGQLRTVSRSDHNPHGFLIMNWKIEQNQDIPTP